MSTQLAENINPELIQGSTEWLATRNKYLGGSEIATIMGYNKYKTPYQLWQQKLGLALPDETTYAMERGRDLEPKALAYVEKTQDIKVVAQPVLVHPEYDFIRVSLDGITQCEQYIVEVKSPMSEDSETHVHASIGGACPLVHYCQVQIALEVARHYYPDLKGAFYGSYIDQNPDKSVVCEVLYDEKFVQRLITKACQFWDCIQSKTPPAMNEDEYENIELAENKSLWHTLTAQYLEYNKLKKEATAAEDKIKKELLKLSAGRNCKGYGIMVYHSERKGTIDYTKIPELRDVDLEKYRKDSTVVSTIKVSSE